MGVHSTSYVLPGEEIKVSAYRMSKSPGSALNVEMAGGRLTIASPVGANQTILKLIKALESISRDLTDIHTDAEDREVCSATFTLGGE